MSGVFENVREILERMLSSYGVKTQQAYAELKKIPVGTIHNWLKRGKLPGDYIVMCALDTGADLKWLVNGELANVDSIEQGNYPIKGERLLEAMQASGGKAILKRLMDAYGFTMQKQLGDHLGVPSGTMSAWLRREHFPGEVVIACALDTGASLYWLATGNGLMYEKGPDDAVKNFGIKKIAKYLLSNGQLIEDGYWHCDESLIGKTITNPILVEKGSDSLCVDLGAEKISNGNWLINIDGIIDLYDVTRLPGNKLSLKNRTSQFDCSEMDVVSVGKAFLKINVMG